MPFCTNCGTEYTNAKFCSSCGSSVNEVNVTQSDNNNQNYAQNNFEKPSHSVRKGMTNASFNEEASGYLFGQIFVVATVTGIYFSSWVVFGAAILGLIFCLFIKELALLLCISLAAGVGFVGYYLGDIFDSSTAGWVMAILFFLSALGWNLAGLQWANDIGD